MELYLFHQDTFQRLYNCSFYSIDSIPLESRQHTSLGAGLIALSTAFTLLYIPCMVVIARHMHQSSSYKFMFFIGLVDLAIMPVCGLLTGIYAIEGAVYCMYPTTMYFLGTYGSCKLLAVAGCQTIMSSKFQ